MSGFQRLYASCIVIDGCGLLLWGPSGAGKSSLALCLIDGGAQLVSDDQTELYEKCGVLFAAPPENLAGLIEARQVGLLRLPYVRDVPVVLGIELLVSPQSGERLPDSETRRLCGIDIPVYKVSGLSTAAPAIVRLLAKGVRPEAI